MHSVIETPTFLEDCRGAGLTENERAAIVAAISVDPRQGDGIPGTGGARKRRFAGRGKGKSGGYRTVSYFAGEDVPVLLLALINKGERADLTQAERNELRRELTAYAEEYRSAVHRRVARLKGRYRR